MDKNKKRVGVLRGGEYNYENSLEKGSELISYIFNNLSDNWQVADIFIDKNNIWHLAGQEIEPADLMHKVDVVWNVSYPSFSNVLQSFSIPTIGAELFSSFIGESRNLLEEHMKQIGVKMPRHFVIPVYQNDFDGPLDKYIFKKAKEVHEKFGAPWIVRPFSPDRNMGIHLAKTFPELLAAIEDGVNHNESILIEEFIMGKNANMHSVLGFRENPSVQAGDVYVFPADSLYDNRQVFSKEEKEKLIYLVKNLHKHLTVKNYLNSWFVVHPKKRIYLTSIDFFPDLKENSHFNKSCESVGAKMNHVIEHILNKALN